MSKVEVFNQLLDYVTIVPPDSMAERLRFKYVPAETIPSLSPSSSHPLNYILLAPYLIRLMHIFHCRYPNLACEVLSADMGLESLVCKEVRLAQFQ